MAVTNVKIRAKLERIARLRLFTKLKDGMIASLLGISTSNLSQIVALPEFEEVSERLLEGQITQLDEAIAGNTVVMQEHFKTAVPAAMKTLVEAAIQRRDLRVAVTAAESILDRDPQSTFAKRTRSQSLGDALRDTLPQHVLAGVIATNNATAAAKPGVPASQPTVVQPPDRNVN